VDFYQRKDEHLLQDEVDQRVVYFRTTTERTTPGEALPFLAQPRVISAAFTGGNFVCTNTSHSPSRGFSTACWNQSDRGRKGFRFKKPLTRCRRRPCRQPERDHGAKCGTPAKLLAANEGSRKTRSQEEGIEYEIATNAVGSPTETAANALALAAILYGRWRNGDDDAYQALQVHAGRDLWAGTLLPALIRGGAMIDLEGSDRRLYQTFIIDRHDQVMYEKHRLDSCWLHGRTGGHQGPGLRAFFRSSRHGMP